MAEPRASRYPAGVTTEEERRRWGLCVQAAEALIAETGTVTARQVALSLYRSDLPNGDAETE